MPARNLERLEQAAAELNAIGKGGKVSDAIGLDMMNAKTPPSS